MARADWALVAQVVAAASAAVAAVFAWRTARQLREQAREEQRVRASEHLKLVSRLITDFVEIAHGDDLSKAFRTGMQLRSELVVTSVHLPEYLKLVDTSRGPLTVAELDRLAPAAFEEVERAQQTVWEGRIAAVYSPGEPDP